MNARVHRECSRPVSSRQEYAGENAQKEWGKCNRKGFGQRTSNDDGATACLCEFGGGRCLPLKEGLWTCQQPGSAPCVALQPNSSTSWNS